MKVSHFFALCAASFFAVGGVARAQVAPAASGGGRPIGISVGISDFSIDYGHDRRMLGPVARGGIDLFHGLGVEGSARSIFMFTPDKVTRMQQSVFEGGAFYEAPGFHGVHFFANGGVGLGLIEFPSNNPKYTRDTYTVFQGGGGFEFHMVHRAYLRAEYTYQSWRDFLGPNQLTPQGETLGVTYYLNRRPR